MKHKPIFIPLVIGLVLVLSLLGAAGCPTTDRYNLTTNVSPTGGGSVSPSGGTYDPGVTVTLTATANSGYVFDYWSGSASGTSLTTTVVMDAHKSVTAHFTPVAQTYTLTTNVSPTGGGSVSPSGGEYDAGAQVSLSATANSGYVFDYWNGSASGTGANISVTMDADKNVVANFAAVGPTVLFSDNFSQDTGDWDVYADADGQAFYEGGWLHVINYTIASIDSASMLNRYFSDFVLEVDTKLVDGTDDNWHGVICRYQDIGNYYAFGISADGFYQIARFVDFNQVLLEPISPSSYVNQGWDVVNSLRIECNGNRLILTVNGYTLASVTDSTFSGGEIGFLATSLSGTFTEVAFDNLVITEP